LNQEGGETGALGPGQHKLSKKPQALFILLVKLFGHFLTFWLSKSDPSPLMDTNRRAVSHHPPNLPLRSEVTDAVIAVRQC
jgi:hypothetical protein